MHVGFLTAPFHAHPLEDVVRFAAKEGFTCLEINSGHGSRHLDPSTLTTDGAAQISKLMDVNGIKISSLAHYTNVTAADPAEREAVGAMLRKVIDAAEMLEVDTVCAMAGMPVPGKSRMQTIEEDVPGVYIPICEYAEKRGVRIALENWFATNIRNLEHWDRIFEVVPNSNFGLNYDPSHLVHQQIDYLWAVEKFSSRIFHTHAKDTEIKQHRLRVTGNQEGGWWRYVIPGYGEIHWGRYIGALRSAGFDGAVSVEHEDSAFGVEEGMRRAFANLKPYMDS